MRKSIRFVAVTMLISSVLLTLLCFYCSGVLQKNSAYKTMDTRIESVIEKTEEYDKLTEQTVEKVRSKYESKTRVLAMILSQTPNLQNDDVSFEELRVAIDAEEISITDMDGKIIYTTAPYMTETYAYTDFMECMNEKRNVKSVITELDGKRVIVAGTARLDTDGIIQVIFNTDIMESATASSDISTVVSEYPLMKKGCVAVIDMDNYRYLSHTKKILTGTSPQIKRELFSRNSGTFATILNGENALGRYKYTEDESKLVIAMISKREIYSARNTLTGWVFFVSLVLSVIAVLIMRMLEIKREN